MSLFLAVSDFVCFAVSSIRSRTLRERWKTTKKIAAPIPKLSDLMHHQDEPKEQRQMKSKSKTKTLQKRYTTVTKAVTLARVQHRRRRRPRVSASCTCSREIPVSHKPESCPPVWRKKKRQFIPAMDREMRLHWAKIKGTQKTEKKGVVWRGWESAI